MTERHLYCIYKLTCMETGNAYIGATCQSPSLRWRNGKSYKTGKIGEEISKYGWGSFKQEILEDLIECEKAAQKEKYYISLYDTYRNGLNSSAGGEIFSESDIEQRSDRLKGRTMPDDVKKKISASTKGRIFSDDHINNLKVSHIGNEGYWTGKKRSPETASKISRKLSMPIKCIETGCVYENLAQASKDTGLSISSINKSCNGLVKNPRSGFNFSFI